MKTRLDRINEEVRKYDSRLYAVRGYQGATQIRRKMERETFPGFSEDEAAESSPVVLVLALTDTWKASGRPVDWGLEPLMAQVRSMDSWSQGNFLDSMRRARERKEEDRKQSLRNEVRARAADLRKDFAKATNEINTAGLTGPLGE